jgi:hypothetical protein
VSDEASGFSFESAESTTDVFIGPADAPVSRRLIDAFSRGEVTEGGMAEAGWRYIGRLAQEEQS